MLAVQGITPALVKACAWGMCKYIGRAQRKRCILDLPLLDQEPGGTTLHTRDYFALMRQSGYPIYYRKDADGPDAKWTTDENSCSMIDHLGRSMASLEKGS